MSEVREGDYLESDLRLEDRLMKQRNDEVAYGRDAVIPDAILAEVEKAKRHGERFASLHEAYAVILEEVDEVWDITRQKRCYRNELELRKEFIQIAAMAIKALNSMDNFLGGNV